MPYLERQVEADLLGKAANLVSNRAMLRRLCLCWRIWHGFVLFGILLACRRHGLGMGGSGLGRQVQPLPHLPWERRSAPDSCCHCTTIKCQSAIGMHIPCLVPD